MNGVIWRYYSTFVNSRGTLMYGFRKWSRAGNFYFDEMYGIPVYSFWGWKDD